MKTKTQKEALISIRKLKLIVANAGKNRPKTLKFDTSFDTLLAFS